MLLQGVVAFTLGYLLLPLWLVKKGTQCKCEQAVPKLCFPLLTYSMYLGKLLPSLISAASALLGFWAAVAIVVNHLLIRTPLLPC